MLADLHRRNAFWLKRWIGGILLGGGVFQLYDGIIQHKWMRLHQIRYNVDIRPYDWVWNLIRGHDHSGYDSHRANSKPRSFQGGLILW